MTLDSSVGPGGDGIVPNPEADTTFRCTQSPPSHVGSRDLQGGERSCSWVETTESWDQLAHPFLHSANQRGSHCGLS